MEEKSPIVNVTVDTGARQISLLTIGKKRNWFLVIILFILTLSIYGLVYTYKLFEETKRFVLVKNPTISVTSGAAAVGFLFVPIFGFLWLVMLFFKTPGLISKLNQARGKGSVGWAWLGLLNFIPLIGNLAVFIITQIKINDIWEEEKTKLIV